MLKPFPFRLAEFLIAAAFAIAVIVSWRADRRDRAQLAADLAAANQSLAQASARQRDRDAQLAQTLSTIATQKRNVTTPQQILRDLPNHLPLPIPIALSPGCRGTGHPCPPVSNAPLSRPTEVSIAPPCSSGTPSVPEDLDSTPPRPNSTSWTSSKSGATSATNPGATALLPVADLKPLYDFTLDCQACQSKLAAAQSDLTDERAKTTTLTHERNEALRAAKGGSTIRRMARAAKWFALGAAAGAIAATARHEPVAQHAPPLVCSGHPFRVARH